MKCFQRYGPWMAAAVLAAAPVAGAQAATQQETKKGQAATALSINAVEENAAKYRGQTIKVTGEVDEVLGPRMFKLDEREWLDFDGETLVYTPAPLAIFVQEGEPVTVTGTLRTVMDVNLDNEWGWFELEPDVEAELDKRNVIVATGIVNRAGTDVAIRVADPAKPVAVGTSGSAATALTDVAMLAGSDNEMLVGRTVDLKNVRSQSIAKGGGFWVNSGSETLFILPANAETMKVNPGETVNVIGIVMAMPEAMNDRVADRGKASHEDIYVYATQVTPVK